MPYKDAAAQSDYQRRWIARRRAQYTAGVRCARCGSAEQINWHHRDPATKVNHRVWSWSPARIRAELKKCVPLCAPCHGELHAAERRLPCGHDATYQRGCRCEACKAAHAARLRAERAR